MSFSLAERLVSFFAGKTSGLFLSFGSSFSIASLFSALIIATAFLLLTRRAGKKQVKYEVMRRALFPRWLRRASFRADVWFLLFNTFAFGMLFGWSVVSSKFVGDAVAGALSGIFGVLPTS